LQGEPPLCAGSNSLSCSPSFRWQPPSREETQIEKLQEDVKKQLEQQQKQRKEYEDFLAGLTME
jgi:hypothetical protein